MTGERGAHRPPRQTAWFFARISLFWLGLSFIWGALNIQILPSRVAELVAPEVKGTALGAIVFVGLAIAIVVQPIAGAVSDRARFRWGRRRPFMAAGVLAAVPFLIFVGLAPNYGLLVVAMIGLQIAANVAHGPYQGVIPDQVERESRGRASGFFGVANLAGTLLGAATAGAFLAADLLLPAVIAIIVTVLASALVSWVFVPEAPAPPAEPFGGVARELRRRLDELRRRSAFGWLMLSRLLFFMGLQAMDNFLQFWFSDELKEDVRLSALGLDLEFGPELKTSAVLAVVLLAAFVTSVPAGLLADRYGKLRIIATAASLGLLSASLMIFAQAFGQVLIFAVLLGIGVGLFTAADWAAAIDLVPDERAAGLYMGLTNVATAGGDALATLAAGIALDLFGARAVFVLMATFFLISLLVLRVVRSRLDAAAGDPVEDLSPA